MSCNGLKKGSFHLFVHPKWSRIIFLEKHIFDPFLVPNQPIFKAFCDFGGAKMACNGLKVGSFHLFRHPKWSRTIFGKNTFLTHFWSQNSPFSRHFGILGGPKRATTSSKHAKTTFFGIPCGPRSFLKISFCTEWTLLTHFATHLFGVHKQVKRALFESIARHFGHYTVTKCFENRLFWDQKSLKYGSKMCFSKDTFGLFGVHKQVE